MLHSCAHCSLQQSSASNITHGSCSSHFHSWHVVLMGYACSNDRQAARQIQPLCLEPGVGARRLATHVKFDFKSNTATTTTSAAVSGMKVCGKHVPKGCSSSCLGGYRSYFYQGVFQQITCKRGINIREGRPSRNLSNNRKEATTATTTTTTTTTTLIASRVCEALLYYTYIEKQARSAHRRASAPDRHQSVVTGQLLDCHILKSSLINMS